MYIHRVSDGMVLIRPIYYQTVSVIHRALKEGWDLNYAYLKL